MISHIINFFLRKKIILFDTQRVTIPIVNNYNKKDYIFINSKIIFFLSKNVTIKKRKLVLWYWVLNIIKPDIILSYDWISDHQKIYNYWARKNNMQFIVVQHGSYVGGIIKSVNYKYANCTKFYCWSNYFKEMHLKNDLNRSVSIINYGNPIYNNINRNHIDYKELDHIKKILIMPSVVKHNVFESYVRLIDILLLNGFDVTVQEHQMQKKYKSFNYKQKEDNSYEILRNQSYDLIISNFSSVVIDAIFLKNRVVYFDPSNIKNIYPHYLYNLFNSLDNNNIDESFLFRFISINNQELLLEKFVNLKSNNNRII